LQAEIKDGSLTLDGRSVAPARIRFTALKSLELGRRAGEIQGELAALRPFALDVIYEDESFCW